MKRITHPLVLPMLVTLATACATQGPATAPPSSVAVPPSVASTPAVASEATRALEQGRALMARGDMIAATVALRQTLQLAPDFAQARASLGLALYAMGDLDAAVDELRGLLRVRPDLSEARLTLAAALVARQDWPAARTELERALAAQPDLVQANYTLGVVRYAQGDLVGAIDAYRRVLAREPRAQDARYNLALVLKLARRDAEATPEFLAAAAAQGVTQADEALAQLRQAASGRSRRPPAERQAIEQAFGEYRTRLWKDYPALAREGDEPLGVALLRQGRAREAVPVLIREAAALSEPALRALETLYDQGVDGQLPAHDARILASLKSAAAEGRARARP